MRKQSVLPGKTYANALPLAAGLVLSALLVVACDRMLPEPEARVPEASAPPAPRRAQAPAPPAMPPREALSDAAITERIRQSLLADPAMRGADISVSTDRGVVTLVGLVNAPEQMAVASAYAQRQDGVVRVDNHLSPATLQ